MGELKFETFVKAIESSMCNDGIKRIVDKLDFHFRSNEVECNQEDWPFLSSIVQKKKDTGDDNLLKKIWRVTFIDGHHCAMINDEDIDFNQALCFAIERFDNKRVLTVN